MLDIIIMRLHAIYIFYIIVYLLLEPPYLFRIFRFIDFGVYYWAHNCLFPMTTIYRRRQARIVKA